MGFTTKQVHALRRNLNGTHVRTRQIQGRELSYIEGWYAIAEANRIFGFDHWNRETVETKCVQARENRGALYALYIAKVRITVRAEGEAILREGYGTGEGHGPALGEVHERALKMAETDATKRALATFGKPFGLGLYMSGRNGRDHRSPQGAADATIPDHDRRRTLQRLGADGRYYRPARRNTTIDSALTQNTLTENSTSSPLRAAQPEASDNPHEDTPGMNKASPLQMPILQETQERGDDAIKPKPRHRDFGEAPQDPTKSESLETSLPPLQASPSIATSHSGLELGQLLISRTKRRREPAHLKFVMTQPCLLCGRTPSDAHHLRFAQPRALGRKVSDEFTVPLCRTHHRQLHQSGNESQWWQAMDADTDPLGIAKGLWEQSRALLPPDASR